MPRPTTCKRLSNLRAPRRSRLDRAARAELERVGLRRAAQELTETELRVAELAATGMTNREIAAQAFISSKTVEANLARVYRKLGIRSRAELGAWLEGRRAEVAPDRE